MNKLGRFLILLIFAFTSCEKDHSSDEGEYVYYEVGFKRSTTDWRDTAFIVRTDKLQLIQQADAQLALPVAERKIVFGALASGSGGYNKNAGHEFNWHFTNDWSLVEITAEIYDGRPYSDVHLDRQYWLDTVKRYGAWGSYIKKKLPGKP